VLGRGLLFAAFPLALLGTLASCVPEGPATTDKAPAAKPAASPPPTAAMRPKAEGSAVALAASRPPITAVFEDNFDRSDLGPDWNALGPAWVIRKGRLCARGAHNKGIWLLRKLPVNARIEFEAYAESAEGDLKAELWGDGVSGATSNTYDNATSYLAILGGWKNTKHVLARLNEHGEDRLELDVDKTSDDERQRPVEAGQPYHFKIERADGKTLSFAVNNQVYFELDDPSPLEGPGHEHLGFNDWEAPVCFENLKVTPL
jgi:Domain of unknown function (DUF6250)